MILQVPFFLSTTTESSLQASITRLYHLHSLKYSETATRPATLLKKRLWHRCFNVNFVKFLRTSFFIEHLWWLLLLMLLIFYATTYFHATYLLVINSPPILFLCKFGAPTNNMVYSHLFSYILYILSRCGFYADSVLQL